MWGCWDEYIYKSCRLLRKNFTKDKSEIDWPIGEKRKRLRRKKVVNYNLEKKNENKEEEEVQEMWSKKKQVVVNKELKKY